MVWTAGPDRRCDYFNERWLEFTGRPLEEELGWGWADRVHPDERPAAMAEYEAAFAERRQFDLEYRVRRADGEYRWVLDTATPRFGAGGAFLGYVGCRTDVTDRRALEHRLKQMERTDAIAQLAGGIAHDFNNLLTGIIGHCSLLLEDPRCRWRRGRPRPDPALRRPGAGLTASSSPSAAGRSSRPASSSSTGSSPGP
jgi:PAS domain S-box-containing protein